MLTRLRSTAIADIDDKRLAEFVAEHGIQGFSSHADLLQASDVDAVLLRSPMTSTVKSRLMHSRPASTS